MCSAKFSPIEVGPTTSYQSIMNSLPLKFSHVLFATSSSYASFILCLFPILSRPAETGSVAHQVITSQSHLQGQSSCSSSCSIQEQLGNQSMSIQPASGVPNWIWIRSHRAAGTSDSGYPMFRMFRKSRLFENQTHQLVKRRPTAINLTRGPMAWHTEFLWLVPSFRASC